MKFYAVIIAVSCIFAVEQFCPQLVAAPCNNITATVQCDGVYDGHLQGICLDGQNSIFWCFTTTLVKTDQAGRLLKKIPVASHHGDLCYNDNKIYVAVNLGKFNTHDKADSWIYIYSALDLTELARHKVSEVVHGAGGIAYHDGRFIVVGGLPSGIQENYAYEYDSNFKFVKRHVISSGYTLMGIQTATYSQGHWWFGCYGAPPTMLKVDESFKVVKKYPIDCALGIVGQSDNSFLVARGSVSIKKHGGSLIVMDADAIKGLIERNQNKKQ